jgi:hypothetical protein
MAIFIIAQKDWPSTGECGTGINFNIIQLSRQGKKEILLHAIAWMKLKIIMNSEGNLTQKATHCITPFLWCVQERQVHRDRK